MSFLAPGEGKVTGRRAKPSLSIRRVYPGGREGHKVSCLLTQGLHRIVYVTKKIRIEPQDTLIFKMWP